MGIIPAVALSKIKRWYYKDFLSMQEIGRKLNVSSGAVVYFMRWHNLSRRTFSEISARRFDLKPLSFSVTNKLTAQQKNLRIIGAMLYWCEGFKGNEKSTNSTVDFANSDPKMIAIFSRFLREIYRVDEKRLRVLLYCYSNQNVQQLISFWSKTTKIPKSQFSKPYVRTDFREDGRKMQYGMIHLRYSDKKLLIELF